MSELLRHRMLMQQAGGGGSPIPKNNQIIYIPRTLGTIVDVSGICNATFVGNEVVGDYVIATFDGDVTTINDWGSRDIWYIDLPQTCTTFSRAALDYSYYLVRVILRASQYKFGQYTLGTLKTSTAVVTLYAPIPPYRSGWAIGRNPFSNLPTIEVPHGCGEAYRNSSYWTGYTIIEMA